MNTQQGSAMIDPGWWGILLAAPTEPTETDRVPVIDPRAGTWASRPGSITFEEHLASLPTLQDLIARFSRSDPGFDEAYERARKKHYEGLLEEARKRRISRLTAERLKCGLTQAELADRAGMKQPNISRLEKAGAVMSVATARRLAKALGLEDYRVLLP